MALPSKAYLELQQDRQHNEQLEQKPCPYQVSMNGTVAMIHNLQGIHSKD